MIILSYITYFSGCLQQDLFSVINIDIEVAYIEVAYIDNAHIKNTYAKIVYFRNINIRVINIKAVYVKIQKINFQKKLDSTKKNYSVLKKRKLNYIIKYMMQFYNHV